MDVRRIEEEVDPDFLLDAHSRTGPAKSSDSCESKMCSLGSESLRFSQFYEVSLNYPLETCSISNDILCLKFFKGGARVAFEDEFGSAEEREVSCEAQQGRSGVKRKLFRSCRNNMGNEPILALPEGLENFVVMRGARVRMLA
ncbi:hypothetical protein Tco_0546473 [Tanacetum coccineum]